MSKTLKMICKSTVDSKTMNFCFALNFVLLTKNSTTNIWNFLWPWLSLWSCITISMQKLHVLLVVLAKPQLSLWIHVNIDRLNYARTFLVIFLVIVNWGLGNKVIWYSKCLFVNETIFFLENLDTIQKLLAQSMQTFSCALQLIDLNFNVLS